MLRSSFFTAHFSASFFSFNSFTCLRWSAHEPIDLSSGRFGKVCRTFRHSGDAPGNIPSLPEFALDKDSQGLRRPATILLRRRISAVTTGTQRMAIDPTGPEITADASGGQDNLDSSHHKAGGLCDEKPVPPPTGPLTRDQVNDARREPKNVTTQPAN